MMNLEQLIALLYPFLVGLILGLIVGGLLVYWLIITSHRWISSAVKAYHKHFSCKLGKAQSRYQTAEKDFTGAINNLAGIGQQTEQALRNLKATVEVISPRHAAQAGESLTPLTPQESEEKPAIADVADV